MPKAKTAKKSFRATLEHMRGNLGWVIAWIPFSVYKTWGSRGNFRVKGEINGFAFRTSLFPTRKGVHFLLVNKKMQTGAEVTAGSTAEFHLEPDTVKRVAVIPPELERFFAEDKFLRRWFNDKLSYSIRRWICDSIRQLKSAASRSRRSEQIAEQMLTVMDAEEEFPPALKLAFSRDPRALEGWNLMSPTHRRHQLLSIFHYRTPDGRARRIDRAVEDAIALAEKKSERQRNGLV